MTQCRSEKVSLAARQRTITLKVYVKCPWPVGIATPTSRSTRLNTTLPLPPVPPMLHPCRFTPPPPSYKGPAWISKRLSDQVSSPPVSKKNQSAADLYQYEENGNSKPGTEADKCGKKYPSHKRGVFSGTCMDSKSCLTINAPKMPFHPWSNIRKTHQEP